MNFVSYLPKIARIIGPINTLKQQIPQESINKIITEIPQDKFKEIAKNLQLDGKKIPPQIINNLKELAGQIRLDANNIEKLKHIATSLNFKEDDIKTIENNAGKGDIKPYFKMNDFQNILNTFSNTKELTAIPVTGEEEAEAEAPVKKIKITDKSIKLPNITDEEVLNKIIDLKSTIRRAEKGYLLSQQDREKYERTLDDLKNIDDNNPDKAEIENYLEKINNNLNIDTATVDTTKVIVNFAQVAKLFKFCLVIIITVCLFIYVIIAILSSINVLYLLFKIINAIISLFYNTVVPNEETLSYRAKQIVKSTNNSFKYDIFNILAEQKTALSIFNSVLYIIYILMAYVIVYLLCIIYVQIMKYTHILKGSLEDIDVKYQIITIIGLLFIFSLLHLLIYKFLYKNMALSNFKEINKFETDVDNKISNIVMTKYNNNEECSKFFDLLADTSKRNELDSIFSNKIKTIKTDNENSLRKYLMMYNIYMYFEEYLYMNDVMKDKIKKYFGISNDLDKDDKDNEVEQISFIGLLDSNERKLLKAYHEDLPFHKLVSKDYIEDYQKITEDITSAINSINKYIIKYTGTFFPFLITCIYICLICIYNIYTLYILFKFIIKTEEENMFMTFIYTFSHKYIYYCEYIYSIFFNK
jgi:hypothetical protein